MKTFKNFLIEETIAHEHENYITKNPNRTEFENLIQTAVDSGDDVKFFYIIKINTIYVWCSEHYTHNLFRAKYIPNYENLKVVGGIFKNKIIDIYHVFNIEKNKKDEVEKKLSKKLRSFYPYKSHKYLWDFYF